jgi:hypothetical protein
MSSSDTSPITRSRFAARRYVLAYYCKYYGWFSAAKAHEALDLLIVGERRIWHGLCQFHFTPEQIDMQLKKCPMDDTISWRHIFFELKKFVHLLFDDDLM